MVARVLISPEAIKVVDQLKKEHGPLMFHQSGGCCDGSSPMCFAEGELLINETDYWLGNIHDCDFFISKDQFEYWQHTQLTVDVVPGRGSSFSLEIPLGLRFVIQSRIFTDEELQQLSPVRSGDAIAQ